MIITYINELIKENSSTDFISCKYGQHVITLTLKAKIFERTIAQQGKQIPKIHNIVEHYYKT
jgi:hypothetical protein